MASLAAQVVIMMRQDQTPEARPLLAYPWWDTAELHVVHSDSLPPGCGLPQPAAGSLTCDTPPGKTCHVIADDISSGLGISRALDCGYSRKS
jgi:hypothetical protein